ncbi:hypothetical protein A2U01_0047653, partial [Trifolium medium]|nr:hypothetical protein [Trifolium medium]
IISPPCGNMQHQKHFGRKQGFLFDQEVPKIYMREYNQIFDLCNVLVLISFP